MEERQPIPPKPEDFKDENGEIDWVSYYEEAEYYELQQDGLR